MGLDHRLPGGPGPGLRLRRLGAIDPQEGGPIAYSGEVSPILGYQAGLLYFHAGWIGNLAVAIAGVDYLSVFFPVLTQPIPAGITTIVVLWIFTALNLLGAAWIGRLVTVGVVALLIPVVLTGTLGWLYFDPTIFADSWNVSNSPPTHAILAAVRASNDGTLPPIFAKKNERGIPVQAIVLTSVMSTVLMLVMMGVAGGGSTQGLFGEIAAITVLFTIIPYFYSALQLMRLGSTARPKALSQVVIAGLAGAFCLTALAGADYGTLVAAILIIFGLLIFYVTKDRSEFEERMLSLRHVPSAEDT